MTSFESMQSTVAGYDSAKPRPERGVAGFFERSLRRVGCVVSQLREKWRARRAYDAFSRLDNHMLADIGANRADMFVAAYAEEPGCPVAANSNEPARLHTVESQSIA